MRWLFLSYIYPDGHRIWFDWQLCRVGHGLRDVCYFMVAALTVDERRQADRRLLDHYRDALLATGAEGVPDRETMWDHFRRWPVYGIQARTEERRVGKGGGRRCRIGGDAD